MYFSIFRFTNFESTSFGWQEGVYWCWFFPPFFWSFFWFFDFLGFFLDLYPNLEQLSLSKIEIGIFQAEKDRVPPFYTSGTFLNPWFWWLKWFFGDNYLFLELFYSDLRAWCLLRSHQETYVFIPTHPSLREGFVSLHTYVCFLSVFFNTSLLNLFSQTFNFLPFSKSFHFHFQYSHKRPLSAFTNFNGSTMFSRTSSHIPFQ